MTEDQRGRQRDTVFLMAIGLLGMTLCGVCTLSVATKNHGFGAEYVIGGIPTLGGAVMFLAGLRSFRKVAAETRSERND